MTLYPFRRRGVACALAQRRFQIRRPAVLAQQVGERLVGELLKRRHAVARQDVERGPGLVVELHPLARHRHSLLLDYL